MEVELVFEVVDDIYYPLFRPRRDSP
jgi:hypothetical protein